MKKSVEMKVNVNHGLVISDPWYEEDVKCRYENRRKMSNYNLRIQANDAEYDGWFNIALTLLDDTAHSCVNVGETLDSFSCPKNFNIKDVEIGMDTAAILIGSNDVCLEGIHTGTDGYLGTVYQLSRPVPSGDNIRNRYCGIILFASFDSDINSIEDVVRTLVYNFSGESASD